MLVNSKILMLITALFIATGCATSANDYYNSYNQIDIRNAEKKKEYIAKNKEWYGSKYQIGYYTDLGTAELRMGDLKKSYQSFSSADDVVDDEFKKGMAGIISAYTYSEENSTYAGDTFEQVQIPLMRSVIAGQMGDWEKALALARRTNDVVQSNVQKIAKAQGFDVDLTDSPEPAGTNSKGVAKIKWHYVNDALAYYVASIAAKNQGDYENALVYARNAIKTYKSKVYRERYLVKTIPTAALNQYCYMALTIDRGDIRPMDNNIFKDNCKKYVLPPANTGEVVVLVMHGQGASKQSITVDVRLGAELINSIIGGVAGAIVNAYFFSDDDDTGNKRADKNVSGGSSSRIYSILMGAMITNPYIFRQVLFQTAELERNGSKGIASGITNVMGAIDPNVIRTSVPITLWYPSHTTPNTYKVGSDFAKVELAHNLDGIRERDMFDNMPMVMTRSLSRGLFRLALQKGVESKGGFWMGLAVGVATKSAESSETRSLRSSPQAIYTSSNYVTAGNIPLTSAGNVMFSTNSVEVKPNKTSFVIAFSN